MTVNSYQTAQTEQAPVTIPVAPPEAHQNVTASTASGVSSFTFSSGQTASGNSKQAAVSATDLTPYAADDWRATARNAFGKRPKSISRWGFQIFARNYSECPDFWSRSRN